MYTRTSAVYRSRPFNVIDVGTNRKYVCNFLLVNNTNSHTVLHHFQLLLQIIGQICVFDRVGRVPLFNTRVLGPKRGN